MTNWDSESYKRRHLRWMQMMRERHNTITREEKRNEEALEIFRSLVELFSSTQRLEIAAAVSLGRRLLLLGVCQ